MSMNPEIKARWVAALRSDEYEKGINCLKEGNRFCCLGVLTDLYAKETNTAWGDDLDGNFSGLPGIVRGWAGVQSVVPNVKDEGGFPLLITYVNDVLGESFEQIADRIEKADL